MNTDDKPRVLLVDDEAANLDTFRRVFRKDFEMVFAESVDEAVRCLNGKPFDVALVDYAMPGQNGVEFLRRSAVMDPTLACLMVTAHADLEEVRQSHQSGIAKGVLMKPWDRESVLRWVENARKMTSLRRSVGALRTSVDSTKRS